LDIAHARETLGGLGSHFRITPQEFDAFFALYKSKGKGSSLEGLISENDFS
jgi:hypothetical protein